MRLPKFWFQRLRVRQEEEDDLESEDDQGEDEDRSGPGPGRGRPTPSSGGGPGPGGGGPGSGPGSGPGPASSPPGVPAASPAPPAPPPAPAPAAPPPETTTSEPPPPETTTSSTTAPPPAPPTTTTTPPPPPPETTTVAAPPVETTPPAAVAPPPETAPSPATTTTTPAVLPPVVVVPDTTTTSTKTTTTPVLVLPGFNTVPTQSSSARLTVITSRPTSSPTNAFFIPSTDMLQSQTTMSTPSLLDDILGIGRTSTAAPLPTASGPGVAPDPGEEIQYTAGMPPNNGRTAGIAVGSIAGFAFILTIGLFFYKWRKGTLHVPQPTLPPSVRRLTANVKWRVSTWTPRTRDPGDVMGRSLLAADDAPPTLPPLATHRPLSSIHPPPSRQASENGDEPFWDYTTSFAKPTASERMHTIRKSLTRLLRTNPLALNPVRSGTPNSRSPSRRSRASFHSLFFSRRHSTASSAGRPSTASSPDGAGSEGSEPLPPLPAAYLDQAGKRRLVADAEKALHMEGPSGEGTQGVGRMRQVSREVRIPIVRATQVRSVHFEPEIEPANGASGQAGRRASQHSPVTAKEKEKDAAWPL